jgi:hypothetical protein
MALVRERTIPTDRPPLVGEVSTNFADRGCRVVSATDSHVVNLGSLNRSRYFSFKWLLSCPHEAEWTRSRLAASQKIWKRRESNPAPLDPLPEYFEKCL